MLKLSALSESVDFQFHFQSGGLGRTSAWEVQSILEDLDGFHFHFHLLPLLLLLLEGFQLSRVPVVPCNVMAIPLPPPEVPVEACSVNLLTCSTF